MTDACMESEVEMHSKLTLKQTNNYAFCKDLFYENQYCMLFLTTERQATSLILRRRKKNN